MLVYYVIEVGCWCNVIKLAMGGVIFCYVHAQQRGILRSVDIWFNTNLCPTSVCRKVLY